MSTKCEYYYYTSSLLSMSEYCRKKEELGERDTSVSKSEYDVYCYNWKHAKDCPYYDKTASSGCYLTTACVQYQGLPDDCIQLETLRRFRDEYMANTDNGMIEIQEYYRKAPLVIDKIKKRGKSDEEFNRLFNDVIEPCVELINKGENEEAHKKYRDMVLDLERRYLN